MYQLAEQIQKEVRKAIVGKDDAVSKALMAILAQGHILLEDVPGVGKTTMALAFAAALGLENKRVQFTPDTMPSDIVGFSVFDKERGLHYQPGAVMTNLLLADEINRTSSKTQSALLEAMEERRVTVDGNTYRLPSPFVVLATQNPVGSAGTMLLPAAQLDRFLIRISVGYPDRQSQVELMKERHHENPLDHVQTVTDRERLEELIHAVAMTHIADPIYDYTAELMEATRQHPYIQLGVSPRGGLAICRAAKAYAFLHSRGYVIPTDIAAVVPAVCGHRIVLSPKARLHEYDTDLLLAEILTKIPSPEIREYRGL